MCCSGYAKQQKIASPTLQKTRNQYQPAKTWSINMTKLSMPQVESCFPKEFCYIKKKKKKLRKVKLAKNIYIFANIFSNRCMDSFRLASLWSFWTRNRLNITQIQGYKVVSQLDKNK